MRYCLQFNILLLLFFLEGTSSKIQSKWGTIHSRNEFSTHDIPLTLADNCRNVARDFANAIQTTGFALLMETVLDKKPAQAIGNIFEFKNQSCMLHGLKFNVAEADADAAMLRAIFANELVLTERIDLASEERKILKMAFGPTSYNIPSKFVPGVNNFRAYGGHTTITLKSRTNGIGSPSAYNIGNGFQYIKVGVDNLRISKGIEQGRSF